MIDPRVSVGLVALGLMRPTPGLASASEQSPAAGNSQRPHPAVVAIRAVTPIRIDGRLDEEAWQGAAPTTSFTQREPDEGRPSSERTEVRVAFDDRALYVGITCFSSPGERAVGRSYRRDFLPPTAGDYVAFVVDPTRDGNGFGFGTNPLGAQDDWQFTGENEYGNGNWNGVWEVATTVDARAWSAEFRIPFRTLRYRPRDTAPWRFNVQRYIAARAEWSFWSPIPRQFYIERVSLAGDLVGLAPPPPALNLQMKPFGVAMGESRAQGATTADGKVGGDLKYSVTPALTLDGTVQTDFSNVEVDTPQVNLTRFPLFFPEKREFFLESADLFNLVPYGWSGDVQPFFSRRIGLSAMGRPVPVVGGVRLTGKATANDSVGLLYMREGNLANDPVTGETVRRADFTVARIRHQFTSTNDFGAIYVAREHGDPTSHLVGIDGETRVGTYGRLDGYWLASDAAGAKGQARYLEAGYTSPSISMTLSALDLQDGFRADIGFVPRTGIHKYYGSLRAPFRPAWAATWGGSEIAPGAEIAYYTNSHGSLETLHLQAWLELTRRDSSRLTLARNDFHEIITTPFRVGRTLQVLPGDYRYGSWQAGARTPRSQPLVASLTAQRGSYWGGTITTLASDVTWFKASGFALGVTYRRDDVELAATGETIQLAGLRLNVASSTRVFGDVTVQCSSVTRQRLIHARLDVIHHPLSDLFVTYDDFRDTFAGVALDRTLTVKLTQLLQF